MNGMNLIKLGAGVFTMLLAGGCGDSSQIGIQAQAQNIANKINPNTINPNSLDPAALNPNALSPSTLHPDSLDPHSLQAILDPGMAGTLSRALVHYLVGCAFVPGQTFTFTWTDSNGLAHDEQYEGILSLAPEWANGPLAPAHEALVSACIASRVNYYGVPVEISSRSPSAPLSTLDTDEKVAYPKIEGAFWGNLFAGTPWVRSCGKGANAANSRLLHRDCAVGHLDENNNPVSCGIMDIVGDCDTVCDPLDPNNQFYPQCNDPQNGLQVQPITTALPVAAVAGSPANLALATSGPAVVTTGACTTISYVSTISSTGSASAASPVFSHFLPPGLIFKSVTASLGTCTPTGGLVTCTLPTMEPGAVVTVTVVATPTTTGVSVSNFTSVVSPTVESSQSDNTHFLSTALQPPSGGWSQVSQGWNGTPIAAGSVIWFTATVRADGAISDGTIWSDPGTITFEANGTTYSIPVPAGKLAVQSGLQAASTSFDDVLRRWNTTVPASERMEPALMTAVAWVVPAELPGGIQSVTMSTHLSASQQNVNLGWSWSAAVYSSFPRGYGALQVVPTDDGGANPYNNNHPAGSPESQLGNGIAGALGSGVDYIGVRSEPVVGAPDQTVCN